MEKCVESAGHDGASMTKQTTIPSPGEETSFPLQPTAPGPKNVKAKNDDASSLIVRHGSSLRLMSQVCEFLANPTQDDTFNYIDPTADHHKWSRRGMELYYAAVVDTSSSASTVEGTVAEESVTAKSIGGVTTNGNSCRILCALRAATCGISDVPSNKENDNDDNGGTSHHTTTDEPSTTETKSSKKRKYNHDQQNGRPRFLIDYVYTAPEFRGKGIAGLLVDRVLDIVGKNDSTLCYVLSLEDSCVYWMEKHQFYLCQLPALNKLLNLFPDTHLLKRRTEQCVLSGNTADDDCNNGDDAQDEEDAELLVKRYVLTEDDESSDSDDGNSNDASIGPAATNDKNDEGMQLFETHLAKLLFMTGKGNHDNDKLKQCLNSLATLIRNAMIADKKDDRTKCQVRINHPVVQDRVFAVGGDIAMELLQSCGFQLEVNTDGDAILHFHSKTSDEGSGWLPLAVSRLEHEASSMTK